MSDGKLGHGRTPPRCRTGAGGYGETPRFVNENEGLSRDFAGSVGGRAPGTAIIAPRFRGGRARRHGAWKSILATARIRLLPDDLVDQIAAGEVVERPASVVKELVENALDAGARRIRVEVRDGGASLIAVTDDGSGMSAEDARRALERHATSKIACGEDLVRIGTFGFRGRSAACDRVGFAPAPADTRAWQPRRASRSAIEGGKLLDARAAGGPEGTRIEVADLFANVPARRKFLKSAATEWGHVAEWLARAALALPGVHFDVQHDDRAALSWPAVGRSARARRRGALGARSGGRWCPRARAKARCASTASSRVPTSSVRARRACTSS